MLQCNRSVDIILYSLQIDSILIFYWQITLLIFMENQKTEYTMLFNDHLSQSLASNWYYYLQYPQIPNNFPLFIFPSTIFPHNSKSNSPELIAFPSTNQENYMKNPFLNKTDKRTTKKEQNSQLCQAKNTNTSYIEAKQKQGRRKKINQLQNIKDKEKDRNILSNSLKLFLKYLRTSIDEPENYQQKIIKSLSLNLNIVQFNQKINQLFPSDVNYVRPYYMKNIITEEQTEFTLILKILLKYFFKQEIYLTCRKPTKIRRSIRNQQIKAGRKLLQYFFGQNQAPDQ